MSKIFRNQLRQASVVFGPRFEEWLSQMLPLSLGAESSRLSREFRVVVLSDLQRQVLRRLVALWSRMQQPSIG